MNGFSLNNTNKTKIQFNQNKNMSWFSKLLRRQEAAIKKAKIEHLKEAIKDDLDPAVKEVSKWSARKANDEILESKETRDILWHFYTRFCHALYMKELKWQKQSGWLIKIEIPERLKLLSHYYRLVITIDLHGYTNSLIKMRENLSKVQAQLPMDGEDFKSEAQDIIDSMEQMKKEAKAKALTEDIIFDGMVKSVDYVEGKGGNTSTVITFEVAKEIINTLNEKMDELSHYRILLK